MDNLNKVRLSDIVELVHGHQFRSEDLNEEMGIPVIKIKQISENGNLDMNNLTYVSDKRRKEFSDFTIKNGDILLSLTGNVGRIVIVKDLKDIALQNYREGKLVVKPGVDQKYVRYLIESPIVKNQLMKNSNQTAQANFGKQDLNKIKIQLLPYEEQQYVGKLLESIDKIINRLNKMIEGYEKLKKGLMQKLLTGKVRVKI